MTPMHPALPHPVTRSLFASLLAISVAACAPSIAGVDTDEPQTEQTAQIDGNVYRYVMNADADKKNAYHYFSFAEAKEVTIDDPAESKDWDLAFQAQNIKLNGGHNGKGGVEIVRLADQNFDALTQAPASGYKTDTSDTKDGLAFRQDGDWNKYHAEMTEAHPAHYVEVLPDVVYVVKATSGKYYKLQLLNYYDETSGTARMISMKWAEIEPPHAE